MAQTKRTRKSPEDRIQDTLDIHKRKITQFKVQFERQQRLQQKEDHTETSRLATFNARMYAMFFIMESFINNCKANKDTYDGALLIRPEIIRILGSYMFDIHTVWTGEASVDLIKEVLKNQKTKKCKDHHFTRTGFGDIASKYIFHCVENNAKPVYAEVCDLIEHFRQVRYVTQKENIKLKKFQKIRPLDPDWCYTQAGIELRKDTEVIFKFRGIRDEQWISNIQAQFNL